MSRYDKRAVATDLQEDRPSLKSFQQELERAHHDAEAQRLAAHHALPQLQQPAPTSHALEEQVASLTIDDNVQDEDTRTLQVSTCSPEPSLPLRISLILLATQERLTTTDDEASIAAIAALLARALQLHQGELILQLDPTAPSGNLKQRALSTLFDAPDPTAVTDSTSLLPSTTVNSILATFELIAGQINARVSVLDNPFDKEGKRKAGDGPPGTETVSSANEDKLKERWRSKALRILVRRVGEGAQDINEVRVCVVGNVDAGKSSLLGGECARN